MRTHHCGPPERLPRSLRNLPGVRLLRRGNAVLEVEDDGVGVAVECLGDLLLAVGGDEQPAARLGHCGFFSRSAERVHSHTSSPRWLKLRCAQVTMPALGRDLLSRTAMHSLSRAQRVAGEDRLGEHQFVVAEVGDERAERRVGDADPDHQSEGEDRIDQRLAELGLGRGFMVEVQRLRIMGQRRDQHIVGLGDGARDRVRDAVADLPLVEIAPWHEAALGERQQPCQATARCFLVRRALRSLIPMSSTVDCGSLDRMTFPT